MNTLTIPSTRILLVLSVLAVMAGCTKKDNGTAGGGGDYYVKFDLDGTPVTYSSDDYGSQTYDNSRRLYTGLLLGYKDVNAGLKNAISITLRSTQPLATNFSYHDPAKAKAANGDNLPQATINYYDDASNGLISVGLLASDDGNVPLPGVVADAQVTITELTSDHMKGSFSGTVYKSNDVTFRSFKRISNGSFYLKRIQ